MIDVRGGDIIIPSLKRGVSMPAPIPSGMIDVIGSQRFIFFLRAEILSEKSVLKFP